MQLKIKNFGPIKVGLNTPSGILEIPKVTLFCGPQGSGKSTATKLFSTFAWLEKWLYRNPAFELSVEFVLDALAWQGVRDYLYDQTEIVYRGDLYEFSFQGTRFSFSKFGDERAFLKPKISYMPAERNFASIAQNVMGAVGLPRPLLDMQAEFINAKIFHAAGYNLYANGYRFTYDSTTGEAWIENGENAVPPRTRLENASSGIQSMVPLLLISDYLAAKIQPDYNPRTSGLLHVPSTPQEKLEMDAYVASIAESTLDERDKQERMERYFSPNRRFINIVEEPEQNLYPETQCKVVNHLVSIANQHDGNRLLLSTHSPFVVNDLVSSSMAASIYADPKLAGNLQESTKLNVLWQKSYAVAQSDMALYEFSEHGEIKQLDASSGFFSDANMLNACLTRWNDMFGQLLLIRERVRHG